MIYVHLPENKVHVFRTKECALRFMYMMRNKGYMILSYSCDDPEDNRWLNRRFKQ